MDDNILFVSTQMEAGGVQIRSTSMQAALLKEGTATDLVFLYKKRPAFTEDEHLYSLLDRRPTSVRDYVGILRRLWRLMRQKRPTAVVGFAHYSSPIACSFAALNGVERRVATQTNPPDTMPRLARWLDFICGVSGVYTHNIAASQSVFNAFRDYPAKYCRRLSVVHNGVASQNSKLSQQQARELFKLPVDVPLIVSCGRLSYQKNHTFLLDVMTELPTYHLAILGEGELRESLQEKAAKQGLSNRVTFVGEVSPELVKEFLRSGDIFAFPSHFEAFGLAVVEAMMSGLPIVSSDHAGLREVVGQAGILLPVSDAKRWAVEIQSVLGNRTLLNSMAERSREQASRFSFESMLDGFKNAILR